MTQQMIFGGSVLQKKKSPFQIFMLKAFNPKMEFSTSPQNIF